MTLFGFNLSDVLVALILIAVVTLVIRKMIRDRKNGKTACGCGCSGCPSKGMCHKEDQGN